MPSAHQQPGLISFDDFVLDRGTYELRRAGVTVPIQRIPLDLLFLFVEREGRLVTRGEIIERVWGKGVFVDSEAGINTAIRKLRKALSDDPHAPRFVQTVPARGYRFVAQLRPLAGPRAELLRPPSSPIVGRSRELSLLVEGLEDIAQSRGRLFLISGGPGIGKSRLSEEVLGEAQSRGMAVVTGHCAERDEAIAYLPFVEILESLIGRESNPDASRAMLGAEGRELGRLLPKLKILIPELPAPLELPPAQARRHLLNCFFEFTARVCSDHSAVMLLEDLHWADYSTLSLLDHIARRISNLPLMMIGTYRDTELDAVHPLAKEIENLSRMRTSSRISLKALPHEDVAAMLTNLSQVQPSTGVVDEIFAATDGNPFFVEELFRHLEEEGRIYDSRGHFVPALRIGERDIPATVRLVVARRLSRLSPSTQKMLATAAVVGRFFDLETLVAVGRIKKASILNGLEEAEKIGLVFSAASRLRPRVGFSHEIVRQAVIAGLSASRLQSIHLQVANAIERIVSTDRSGARSALSNRAAELAWHFSRGGDSLKAARYALHAVRRYTRLGSNAEALAHFESGMAFLSDLPEDQARIDLEIDLRNEIFTPLGETTGLASSECERSCARAVELCRRPGTHWLRRWTASYSMFFVLQHRPAQHEAEAIAAELMELAEQEHIAGYLSEAENWFGYAKMIAGEFKLARRALDRSWARLESIGSPDTRSHSSEVSANQWSMIRRMGTHQNNRILAAWNLWFQGYPETALEQVRIATELAQAPDAPKNILADIHGFASYIHELRREPELMRARAEARLALANESGFLTGRALSEIYLGWADALAGDRDGGIARMKRPLAKLKDAGSAYISDRCLLFIAAALGKSHRFQEGLELIDDALEFTDRTGQKFYLAELHRIRGELLLGLRRSTAARAGDCFRTAIRIARQQDAKSWELRATTSLARLLILNSEETKARSMLTAVLKSFSQGVDTPDLKEAATLIEQLGGSSPNQPK